jgi:hypothetical protein
MDRVPFELLDSAALIWSGGGRIVFLNLTTILLEATLSTIHDVTGRRLVSSIYSWDIYGRMSGQIQLSANFAESSPSLFGLEIFLAKFENWLRFLGFYVDWAKFDIRYRYTCGHYEKFSKSWLKIDTFSTGGIMRTKIIDTYGEIWVQWGKVEKSAGPSEERGRNACES